MEHSFLYYLGIATVALAAVNLARAIYQSMKNKNK